MAEGEFVDLHEILAEHFRPEPIANVDAGGFGHSNRLFSVVAQSSK